MKAAAPKTKLISALAIPSWGAAPSKEVGVGLAPVPLELPVGAETPVMKPVLVPVGAGTPVMKPPLPVAVGAGTPVMEAPLDPTSSMLSKTVSQPS